MKQMVRKGKPNRHEKVLQCLLSGKPVSPQEIADCFKGTDQEKVMYRLSTNIYNCRLDGAVIKVIKSGRAVTGYQLVNPDQFDQNGRFKGTVAKSPSGVAKQSSDESFTQAVTA